MSGVRKPSLAEQGRRLHALQGRIESILGEAEARAQTDPTRATAWRAQAQAEAAPLVAEGVALRDALVTRARRRARLAWRAAYAGCAMIAALLAWLLL